MASFVQQVIRNQKQQVPLGGRICKYRSQSHAGFLGNLPRGGLVVADGREELPRCAFDPFELVEFVGLAFAWLTRRFARVNTRRSGTFHFLSSGIVNLDVTTW